MGFGLFLPCFKPFLCAVKFTAEESILTTEDPEVTETREKICRESRIPAAAKVGTKYNWSWPGRAWSVALHITPP